MRVLVQTDMEGVSQITSVAEILPLYRDYWAAGRRYLTGDVAAAVSGLLEGGAAEVVVDDQHLDGPANIMQQGLPDRAVMPGGDVIFHQLRAREFDAVFQVGRHSRWGTNDGFIAHTQLPGISLAIDRQPITESHIGAWRAGVPVLGITGDDKLGPQIDGALAGTPFLAVKRSRGLTETCPVHRDATRSQAAIRAFAKQCVQDWRARSAAELPPSFELSAHLAPELARRLDGKHRLKLVGRSVLTAHCEDWWRDAEPAMQAATGVVARPLFAPLRALNLTSADHLSEIDPGTLERTREHLTSWLSQPETIWNE